MCVCARSSLSAFQRLLLLRTLRPDKFVPAVAEFVSSFLGPKFTHPPPFDLAGDCSSLRVRMRPWGAAT